MGNVRSGRDIDAALRKKGFRRETDGKHIWYHFTNANGEVSHVKTMISHGMLGSTIGAPLISEMARQLHFSKRQFLEFVDCHIDEEALRTLYQEQGLEL